MGIVGLGSADASSKPALHSGKENHGDRGGGRTKARDLGIGMRSNLRVGERYTTKKMKGVGGEFNRGERSGRGGAEWAW